MPLPRRPRHRAPAGACPPPGGLSTVSVAVDRRQPVLEAAQSAAARASSAPPLPSSVSRRPLVALPRGPRPARASACACWPRSSAPRPPGSRPPPPPAPGAARRCRPRSRPPAARAPRARRARRARPRSVRIAGWMPRASSRSSASAIQLLGEPSTSAGPGSVSARRACRSSSESPTSCCCAPSCRSRSRRRRAASAASTMRRRETRSSSSRARRSAFRRSLSIAIDGGGRGADELAGGVQRGVVDDRRDAAGRRAPRPSRRGRCPARAASTGRPLSSTKRRGQGASRRSRPTVAQALGEHLADRAAGAAAGRSSARVNVRSTVKSASSAATASTAAGSASAPSATPSAGPERPRPEVVEAAEPAMPWRPADEQASSDDRRQADGQRAAISSGLRASSGGDAPQRAVRQHVQRPAPGPPRGARRGGAAAGCGCRGSGWRRGGRAGSSQRLTRRRPSSSGRPMADDAERGAEHQRRDGEERRAAAIGTLTAR